MTSRTLTLLSILLLAPSVALAGGSLDGVSGGFATGWALDEADPSAAVQLHFYGDAPAGQGRLLGTTTATLPRPDVNTATGLGGDHGFRFRLPAGYGSGQRRVYAYAILPAKGNPLLPGSPRGGSGAAPAPVAPAPAPVAPVPTPAPAPAASRVGTLEAVRADGTVQGWAYDPQAQASSIQVHLYRNGPAGQGQLLGSVEANGPRPDVNSALGITGRHGFRFVLPAALRSGGTIYAYAILSGPTNPLLSGAPLAYGSGATATPSPAAPPAPALGPGSLDGVSGDGIVRGWSSQPEVFVKIDGTEQGSVEAMTPHGGVAGDRGFAFAIPNAYRDGRAHVVEAFVQSAQGRESIGSSPFTLARPGGSLTVRGTLLTVQTSASYGAAINAIHIRGKQIVNNTDHGRQVQVAWNYGEAEVRMPTEAGNNRDRGVSTSVVLDGSVSGPVLATRSLPAYWGKPGTQVFNGGVGSGMTLARNKSEVTPDVLTKRLEVDYLGNPNLIRLQISVTPVTNEPEMLIEIPAIYLERSQFGLFLHLDPQTGVTTSILPARTQRKALILASADRRYAVGVYSPDASAYGNWDFGAGEKTTKINVMTSRRGPIPAGVAQRYRSYLAVGTVDEVVAALRLARQQH